MNHLFAAVKAVKDTGGPGTFEAVASMDTLDRDGEIIAKGAFNPLPPSLPIHVDHRMDSENLVGTGRPYYTSDGVLKVQGTFAGTPKAQVIRQLVIEGHLNSMSVGFMGMKRSDVRGIPTITNAELLEVSFVSVPSNREARVLASRAFNGGPQAVTELLAKARAISCRALVELALVDLDELDRRHGVQKSPKQVVAEAEALLRRLKGTTR